MTSERPSGRRASFAERKERRATIDDPAVVLEAAARFLEPRARSVVEVRRRLTGAGYQPDLVEGAIDRMLELGMLDDDAFARAWVESRDRARPRGERALRTELGLKGVDRAIIDEVLETRRTGGTETGETRGGVDTGEIRGADPSPDAAAAARLLARHARALGRVLDPRARRQRAYALLARNGFDPDVCRTVAPTVDNGASAEDSDE